MRYKHWHYHGWHRRPAFAYSATTCTSDRERSPFTTTFTETRMHRHRGGRGDFGVRRPLRYLRYQLDLDEAQTRRVAAILNRLKLEREQAELDDQRALNTLADRIESGAIEQVALQDVLEPRAASAKRLQQEVATAVTEMCHCLDDDQRLRFAELMRTGAIVW